MQHKFKIGDRVIANTGIDIGNRYVEKNHIGVVTSLSNFSDTTMHVDGKCVYVAAFSEYNTPLPLYSEEQAASFLREKGYKVEEPPKPQTGHIQIIQNRNGDIYGAVRGVYISSTSKVIAIVDWTEGQGLPKDGNKPV